MRKLLFAILTAVATAGLVVAVGGASIADRGGQGGFGDQEGFGDHGGFGSSRVVGQVYVNDNTTGTNTVAGFDRHADGTLTAIPGSPFAVGGAGTGAGIASQGSLQLSRDGRYLLAVDGGSNQISVARILRDGSLQVAGTGPVSSNGANPVSIAVHNSLVYVATRARARARAKPTTPASCSACSATFTRSRIRR